MSAALDEYDEEDETLDEKTSVCKETKESMLEKLRDRELLRYGALITEPEIEHVMNLKKSDIDILKWPLIVLQFRELIKNQGFYITSRGRNDSLYILMQHEMADYNEKKNKANFRNLKQRQRALHMIDATTLNKEAQKKLEFEIFRNASIELEFAGKMKERCRY